MAVAWLIEVLQAYPTTFHTDTGKARTHALYPYLEAVGSARIMEISLEPALSREQKAVSLPLYCIL